MVNNVLMLLVVAILCSNKNCQCSNATAPTSARLKAAQALIGDVYGEMQILMEHLEQAAIYLQEPDTEQQATAFLAEREARYAVVRAEAAARRHLPGGTAELIFHCFDMNDPRLGTPSYVGREPDVIIESR